MYVAKLINKMGPTCYTISLRTIPQCMLQKHTLRWVSPVREKSDNKTMKVTLALKKILHVYGFVYYRHKVTLFYSLWVVYKLVDCP